MTSVDLIISISVLTQVHVSNEGEAEQVNEEEDHILEALANLLQNTTLPQYQRIRERLDLRIMRATERTNRAVLRSLGALGTNLNLKRNPISASISQSQIESIALMH